MRAATDDVSAPPVGSACVAEASDRRRACCSRVGASLYALAVLALMAGAGRTALADAPPAPGAGDDSRSGAERARPSILLIVTDDQPHQVFGGFDSMPILRERLLSQSVSFTQSIATMASCAPMRASILTGAYPRRHGVEAVGPPLGGAPRFRTGGADQQTIACWLQQEGYLTGFFGKYMNGYDGTERMGSMDPANPGSPRSFYVPPCWDRWRAMASPEGYGGIHGQDYEIVAWDSSAPKPVCRDHCPPGCRRCANSYASPCAADADCLRFGENHARCLKPGDRHGAETIGCCGRCSRTTSVECNDDAMCPQGEACRVGCQPTRVHGGHRGVIEGPISDREYSTDLLGEWVRDLISEAARTGKPFFAVYSPYAAHGVGAAAQVAARHFLAQADSPPWRPTSYNEADVSDKPRWLERPKLPGYHGVIADHTRRRNQESLMAVDEQIGLFLNQLDTLAIRTDTVIAYVSDNGLCFGEHRLFDGGKGTPYECAIRVPIMFDYPAARHGPRVITDRIATLQDIPVTLADLAGVRVPVATDGISLAPWLRGETPQRPPRSVLIESWGWGRGDCLRYRGNPQDGDTLRLYYGDRHATENRPNRAFEWDNGDGVQEGHLSVPIGTTEDESIANLANAIRRSVPGSQVSHRQNDNHLSVLSQPGVAPEGYYFIAERDHGKALQPCLPPPDFYGVRDERGYTYVAYNNGERELYDLNTDPDQLRNVHGSPAYARVEAELAQRLQQLLREVPRRDNRRALALEETAQPSE